MLQTTQGSATTHYLYGLDRLASLSGSRTWYGADALGSVRADADRCWTPLGCMNYDPWGTVESGDGADVWVHRRSSRFLAVGW